MKRKLIFNLGKIAHKSLLTLGGFAAFCFLIVFIFFNFIFFNGFAFLIFACLLAFAVFFFWSASNWALLFILFAFHFAKR